MIGGGFFLSTLFATAEQESVPGYQVDIKRTDYGVPHIFGNSYKDVGFGLGYVFAQDNYCVFGKEILTIRSQKAKYISADRRSIGSDLYHSILAVQEKAQTAWPELSQDTRAIITGYSTGLNHYRNKSGAKTNCAISQFVGDITPIDIVAYQLSLSMNASSGQFMKELVMAETPSKNTKISAVQLKPNKDYRDLQLGSNAWAIGDENGKYHNSFLLANPHFHGKAASVFIWLIW